jgi:hypothetical protein
LASRNDTRRFKTEEEKREHVIKLNLARRHLEPWQWGQGFKMLLETKGIDRKAGAPCKGENRATMAQLSTEVGVPIDTAKKRLRAADAFDALPAKEKRAVVSGKKSLADCPRSRPPCDRWKLCARK